MFENKLPLIPKLPALRIRGMWVAENWRIALSVYIVPSDPLNTYTHMLVHMHMLVYTHSDILIKINLFKKYIASGRCLSFSKPHRQ